MLVHAYYVQAELQAPDVKLEAKLEADVADAKAYCRFQPLSLYSTSV